MRAVVPTSPPTVTAEARRQHEVSHVPYRSWCKVCVQTKGRDKAHPRQGETHEGEEGLPKFEADFAHVGRTAGQDTLAYLSVVDVGSGSMSATTMPTQSLSPFVVGAVVEFIDSLGYDRVVAKQTRTAH